VPIEAIFELGQVGRGMLPADGMVRTGDRVLGVPEQRIDPVELRICHAGTPTADDMALISVGGRIVGPEASEAIAVTGASLFGFDLARFWKTLAQWAEARNTSQC
jgi:hypothetical protein